MSLGSFFLKAILDVDGQSVVIDTAAAPYVVTEAGPIEVANGALSLAVIEELLARLLPAEAGKTLDRLSAVDTELPLMPEFPGEHFRVIAVRVGAALRIEISRDCRRRQAGGDGSEPQDSGERWAGPAPEGSVSSKPVGLVDDIVDLESMDDTPVIDEVRHQKPATQHPERWRRTLPPLLVSPTAPPLELFKPVSLAPASEIVRLLRLAAGRGASTLYVAAGAHPAIRVDGAVEVLENEPSLNANETESLILAAMPRGAHNALRTGDRTEWISVVPAVGRVRCLSFRDVRGASGVFRMTSASTRRISTGARSGSSPKASAAAWPRRRWQESAAAVSPLVR